MKTKVVVTSAFIFTLVTFLFCSTFISNAYGEIHHGQAVISSSGYTGGCAMLDPVPQELYVGGMNNFDYGNADLAGAYIEVIGPKGKVNVLITDIYYGGNKGDLYLNEKAYEKIADKNTGKTNVSWKIIQREDVKTVSFKYMTGSSKYWIGLIVRDTKYPVKKFEIKDKDGKFKEINKSTANFYSIQDPGEGPYTFRITDIYGQTIIENDIPLRDGEIVSGSSQFKTNSNNPNETEKVTPTPTEEPIEVPVTPTPYVEPSITAVDNANNSNNNSTDTGNYSEVNTNISGVRQLCVKNSALCDTEGNHVQLKGMSSHGLQWFGQFMNSRTIKWLKEDWNANVVRAAMYTSENGYISNPSVKSKVEEIVNSAIENGIYVIIDWHILYDNDPNQYKEQAKAFFREMATKYGKYPNVLYEICNEPNGGVTWENHVKPYAEEVIPVIRNIAPDSVILCGSPTWSQEIDRAADSPLNFENILYTLHFYAGTHGQWLRDKVEYATQKGIAVFVSEWGTSDASGNGGPYLDESKVWLDYLDKKKISWVNWSLCDKNESSAALAPGASADGGWSEKDLSISGKFVRQYMRKR